MDQISKFISTPSEVQPGDCEEVGQEDKSKKSLGNTTLTVARTLPCQNQCLWSSKLKLWNYMVDMERTLRMLT